MDWHFGTDIDDLIVPREYESLDKLLSSNNWMQRALTEPECFMSSNKYLAKEKNSSEKELSFAMVTDVSANDKVHTRNASTTDVQWTLPYQWPDYQDNDLVGVDQMEDIFLNSLLEDDMTGMEDLEIPFSNPPESQQNVIPAGPEKEDVSMPSLDVAMPTLGVDMPTLDVAMPSLNVAMPMLPLNVAMPIPPLNVAMPIQPLKVVMPIPPLNVAMPMPSLDVAMPMPSLDVAMPSLDFCNSKPMDIDKGKAPVMEPPVTSAEQNNIKGAGGKKSKEETVLQELASALTQLSDETRVCFRDALYRLAQHSKVCPSPNGNSRVCPSPNGNPRICQSQNGNLVLERPRPWIVCDETAALDEAATSEADDAKEETNNIDRAVASLVFNKMDHSAYKFMAASSSANFSNQDGSGSADYNSQEAGGSGGSFNCNASGSAYFNNQEASGSRGSFNCKASGLTNFNNQEASGSGGTFTFKANGSAIFTNQEARGSGGLFTNFNNQQASGSGGLFVNFNNQQASGPGGSFSCSSMDVKQIPRFPCTARLPKDCEVPTFGQLNLFRNPNMLADYPRIAANMF